MPTLLAVQVTLLLSACMFVQRAPERSFAPEDLLVSEDIMPAGWQALGPPFLPVGDDLVTSESTEIRFGVASREPPIQAVQDVYRLATTYSARRHFEDGYLRQVASFDSVGEWTYQSPIAEQSHFGCLDWAGRATPVCEWAGQYAEYIVVFRTHMTPGEVSLADIERVVKAIDERMAHYLGKANR